MIRIRNVVKTDRGKIVQVHQVLGKQGLVTAKVFVDEIDLLLRSVLTKHKACRITGKDIENKKHRSSYTQHHKRAVKYPFKNKAVDRHFYFKYFSFVSLKEGKQW